MVLRTEALLTASGSAQISTMLPFWQTMTMHALTVASGKARGVTSQAQEDKGVRHHKGSRGNERRPAGDYRERRMQTDAAREEGTHPSVLLRTAEGRCEREEGRLLYFTRCS